MIQDDKETLMSDPFAIETLDAPRELAISESAVERLTQLIEAEGDPNLMLRVTVSGGGCSGYQYGFDFDTRVKEEDLVFERGGVKVVTDEVSMDLLAGSELDYVDELVGAYFRVHNPNATSSCGCGTSFSV
jgi:iron-sulfur cluster insertion protein